MNHDAFKQWVDRLDKAPRTKTTLLGDAAALDADLGDLDIAYDQDGLFLMGFFIRNVSETESRQRKDTGKRRDIAASRGAYLSALEHYRMFRAALIGTVPCS